MANVHYRGLDGRSWNKIGDYLTSSGVASESGYYLVISPSVINSLGGTPDSTIAAGTIAGSALRQNSLDPAQPASDFTVTSWTSRGWSSPVTSFSAFQNEIRGWISNNLDNSTINPGASDFNFYLTDTIISGTRYLVPVVYLGNDGPVIVDTFLPSDISGLVLWLDPTKNSSLNSGSAANGDSISSWSDQSATGTNLNQATAGFRPSYSSTGINGNPSIYYSSSDLGLVGTFAATLTTYTIAAVIKPTTMVQYGIIWSDTVMYGESLVTANTNQLLAISNGYDGTGSTAVNSVMANSTYVTMYKQVQYGGKNIYLNNVNAGTMTGNGGSLTTFGVGGKGWSGFTGFQGYIGHIVAYNRALSDSERTKIYNFLKVYAGV